MSSVIGRPNLVIRYQSSTYVTLLGSNGWQKVSTYGTKTHRPNKPVYQLSNKSDTFY